MLSGAASHESDAALLVSHPFAENAKGWGNGLLLSVLVVKDVTVDVGPELPEPKGACIDSDVQAPLGYGVANGPRGGGIIEIRDARGSAGAKDFADVEDFVSRVGAGDDGAAEGIARAFGESAAAERVIAPVFPSDGGKYELDPVVFAGLVHGRMPKIASVAGCSLMELGRCALPHVVERDDRREEDGGVIERIFSGAHELVFDGFGR